MKPMAFDILNCLGNRLDNLYNFWVILQICLDFSTIRSRTICRRALTRGGGNNDNFLWIETGKNHIFVIDSFTNCLLKQVI